MQIAISGIFTRASLRVGLTAMNTPAEAGAPTPLKPAVCAADGTAARLDVCLTHWLPGG
jgi:hypothetical protein